MNRYLLIALICFGLFLFGCAPESGNDGADNAKVSNSSEEKAGLDPTDDAFLKPGPVGDGSYILSNGRLVRPAGLYAPSGIFTIDLGVSPDGNTLVAVNSRDAKVRIFDISQGGLTQTQVFDQEIKLAFSGVVFNAAGDRFWVSGGGNHGIYEFDLIDGTAVFIRNIKLAGYPSNLVLSADEKFIYTALHMNKRAIKVRLSDGKEVASYPAHLYPYDIEVTEDESTIFVSNQGANSVSMIDTATGNEIWNFEVGLHPEEIALSPNEDRLYVANTDDDSITVIDTEAEVVLETWNLHDEQVLTMGANPVALDLSPDGSRLYVSCVGYDSVDVVDTTTGEVVGRIPTGWYTTNAAVDPVNERLFIVSAKGLGSAGYEHAVRWPGIVQMLDIPDSAELADYTEDVEDGFRWAHNFYESWMTTTSTNPIPTQYGQRSDKIKHVIFVLKENKTYDQILGDLAGAEGDPQFTLFGEEITPNHHALARAFTNCDNFYVEGDTSVIGHLWSTYMVSNDHAEKAFLAGGQYPLPDMDPVTRPKNKTIFQRVRAAGLDMRIYGEAIGTLEDIDGLAPYIDLHYGFWNMGTSDEHEKAEEIIREWEAGVFPDFIFIVLPNDHNYGGSAGAPTPRYLLGDNDAGLGKLVDWVSHSQYWDETAIFVTEDDPQSGWDHIDPHRTIGLVISPWAKRRHVSSVLYSQSSMWHTIALILGIDPATKYDQYAAPMFDCFTDTKDSTPYNYIPNPIPFELNGEDKGMDKFCGTPNFLVPDGAPGMARVLWAMYKGDQPFPDGDSVEYCDPEEIEEEAEEVEEYVETVNRLIQWGRARGIETPVPEGWWELTARVAPESLPEK